MNFFEILHKDSSSGARTGIVHTGHGDIHTPVFMPVGTQATVKSLTGQDLKELGTEIILNNTYHLYLRPGEELINDMGGVHKFQAWEAPILTDSGGFQVFSLGLGKLNKEKGLSRDKAAESLSEIEDSSGPKPKVLAKVEEDGVTFRSHLDGSIHKFTPHSSIQTQHKLGADIILAFDECTPYPADLSYARKSLDRTHRWALGSLSTHQELSKKSNWKHKQFLFGIVQGATYKQLREESAKYIDSLEFDGFCIGGVSVGEPKAEMYRAVEYCVPFLREDKPRHLLGVGDIDDVFNAVGLGVDMFDCVAPTRLARNGTLYVNYSYKREKFRINIYNSEFREDKGPIDDKCPCFTCQTYSRAYLHHLYRADELLAYRLGSIHNLSFMMILFRAIKDAIPKGDFRALREIWLSN